MRISEWRNIIFGASLILGFALFASGSAMGQEKSQAPNAIQATPSTTLSDAQRREIEKIVRDLKGSGDLSDRIEVEITKLKKNLTDYEKSVNAIWDTTKVAAGLLLSVILATVAGTFFLQSISVNRAAKNAVEEKGKEMKEDLEKKTYKKSPD